MEIELGRLIRILAGYGYDDHAIAQILQAIVMARITGEKSHVG